MHSKKRDELVKKISSLISPLTKEEKKEIFDEVLGTKQIGMPISIFKADISGLEIITKYLKEVKNKSFKESSKILNRKISTLYNTYSNSKIKFKGSLDISDDSIIIPFDIFSNRKYSVLESIVAYLKDKEGISFSQTSVLLNRSYNTIKTVYRRFRIKKRKK